MSRSTGTISGFIALPSGLVVGSAAFANPPGVSIVGVVPIFNLLTLNLYRFDLAHDPVGFRQGEG